MKVYVVKRNDGKFLSGYNNYDYRLENPCKPCWTEKLYNAKMFEEYVEADNFCNTIDCQIVEVELVETKDIADHTKQVRKEVFADLKEKYKQKMANALSEDYEEGHWCCDKVLEELLQEIGFEEILELYQSQPKWYE